MSWVIELFTLIWRFFSELSIPILDITFAQLYLGIFVVGVSLIVIRLLLGIGGFISHQALNESRWRSRRAQIQADRQAYRNSGGKGS